MFLSAFGEYALGQCNGLNVSLGSDIEACNGANITLTATYNGGPSSGTPTYQWSFNSNGGGGGGYVIILGANSSTYTIPNFNNSADGTYSCTVTFSNVNNCADSDNVNVNFPNNNNNNFDVNAGSDFTICQGSNATINTTLSNAPGGGNVTYEWNSVPAISGTYPTLSSPTFSGLATGTYNFSVSATATNNGNTYLGCDIVQVTVNNLNLNAGNDQTICQGSPFNITSTISNNPNAQTVNYSWTAVNTITGTPVTLSQTGSPSNPTFNNLPAGTYTFTGTATVNGCSDTDQIQVIVNPNPTTPTFTIPATGCPGVAIPISGFTPVSGLNYTWNDTPSSGPNVNGGSTSNPTLTFTNGGNFSYTVTATNPITGCSSTSIPDQINITNLGIYPPDINYVNTTNYLSGQSYNGVYTYDVCDATGVVEFLITNNTNTNNASTIYSYSGANGTQISNYTSSNITPNLGNNYFTITGTYNGCTVSQTFNIYVGSNPVVSVAVGNSLNVCDGGSVSALITPGAISPGTTYNLYFSDNPGVIVQTLTDISVPTYANPYTFTSGSCGYSVQGNNCVPNFPNVFYAYVVATNACEVSCGPSTPITVLNEPEAGFNISQTTTCVNTNVTLSTTAVPGNQFQGNAVSGFTCTNAINSQWSISPNTGYTVVTGSLGSTSLNWQNWNGTNNVTLSFNTAGTYSITQKVQSNAGCGLRDTTRTICVIAPPTCAFTANPNNTCTPLVTNITNNTTGPSCGNTPLALAYTWTVTNPAGGTSSVATSTAVNPTITLNNNTVAPNLAALNFPITLVVNPLIPGTSTPVPNCSSTCNQTVTVYPQPSFITEPVQPPTVCLDGTFNALSVTVSYFGPGLPSYQWYSNINPVSSGGILIPGATSSSYVPPAIAVGTIYYYCVVTFPQSTLCTTITSNNVPAIVVPDPIALANPTTQTICVGGTVPSALTGTYTFGTGNPTYQWNLVGTPTQAISGATLSAYTPPAFSSTGTFNYTVTINTSGSGCTASTSTPIEVVVIPDPTITVPLATQTLCQNATPTALTVAASGGSGTLQYQWFSNTTNSTSNGTLIPGATNNTFIPPTTAVGTIYYYCIVTTPVSGCSITSAISTVIVNLAPTFTTQPTPSNVCVGGTPTQMCVTYINGTGTPSYQWYSNAVNNTTSGTAIFGATASCYTPPSTTAGTTYYYAIISLTGGGCSVITSNTAAVVITPDPVLATQPTSTQTICVGGSSSALTVALQASTGIGAFSYQWYSNTTATNSGGSQIAGANAATYAPPVFNTAGTFYYYCVVTDAGNGCGTVTSLVATVVVVVDPTVTAPIATQTLCQTAAPAPLTVTASGGTGTFLYQWYSNTTNNNTSGTLITGATASTYSPPTATVGTMYYYCIVTTAVSGCSVTSATSAVIVNPAPNFTTQPVTSTVCVGGTTNQMCVAYANGTGTAAYQWYSNVNNNTTGGTSISGATSSCFTPPSTTAGSTYYYAIITLTGGGCASITSNTAAVIVAPDPVLTTQPTSTQTFCVGGSSAPLIVALQTNTGIGAFTYQWYSNTTATNSGGTPIGSATSATYTPAAFTTNGTFYYYCVVTDAGNGCGAVTSQVATVVVVADPTVTAPIATQTLCQTAAPAPLTVTASGGTGTLLYQWYSNSVDNITGGTLIGSATSATYTPPTTAVGTVYYYCVITTAASGCSVTSATATIIVTQAPTFTTQPTASNVCVGGTPAQMCVVYANGTGTAAYQWYSNSANNTTGGTQIASETASCYTPPSTTAGTTYYYAVITLTGGGCSSITSNTAEVIISTGTSLSTQPTPSQTICVGGTIPAPLSVTYAGGVGTPSYQWYSSSTPIVGATSSSYTPPTFSTAGNNSYYVIVTLPGAGCGAQTSNTASIVVVPDPTATISSNSSYCQNVGNVSPLAVVVTGGTGTPSYQWYSNTLNSNTGGTIISGANTISYSPPVATTGTTYYYCMITQSGTNCAVNSPAAQIIVTPAPTFTTQPTTTQSVCIGGTTTQLNVAYSNGTGTASYQWYANSSNSYSGGTAIPLQTNASFTPPSLASSTIYYYCIVSFSASGGCSMINSNIAEVVVVPDPIISTQPLTTQTICVGGTIPTALNVAYTGGVGTPTYQWFESPSNIAIVGATSYNYTPPIFSAPGTTSYYVSVTLAGAGCGIQTSNVANILVVADPTVTATNGTSYCQNAGNVTPLSVTVSNGQGTTSYQWYSNIVGGNTTGSPITGATAISYTPPVTATGITYYYCVITQSGANCSVNSPAAQITVTPAPNFTTQPTNTQSVCVGGITTQLSVAYSNGTGTATYQWYANSSNSYSGGTAIPLQTNASFTPPSLASSTIYYYCIVSFSASGGCSMINSNIAEVVVVPDPIISTQPLTTQTICVGGTIPTALNVAYTGGVGTPTYQWYAGTPTSSISGATASSYTPPVFTIAGTSNYYATISLSGSGCDVLTSTNGTVIVVADPTATISSGASYCQNAGSVVALAVVVSGGQGTPSFQWYSNTTNSNTGGTIISGANTISYSPPVATTGTTYYYCMITQSGTNCAVNSPAAQIIVTPAPTFTTQPTITQSVCIGGTTTQLNVAYSNGTGTASYQWYSNTTNTYAGGTQIAGQTLSSFTPPSAASATTYYYCIISFSASGGCSMISSDISTVIVVPDPTISTQPLTTQTICVGGTIPVAINVAYTGGLGNPTYQWFGGTPPSSLTGATNSSFTPPTFTTPGTYNYYATVSLSGIGCDVLTTANASINVVADPIVSAQPTATQSVCQNTPTAQISVSVTGGNGSATYQWFSNTTSSNTGGIILVGETLNTFTPPSSVVGTQFYYCVINQTGANCGVTSNPAAVIVNLAPVISTQPLSAQQHCLNAATNNLQVAYANGTGLPSYQWFVNITNSTVGGTPINTAVNNVFTPPSSIAGTYYYYCVISFVSGGGCPSINSNVSEVIVHPYPILTITGGETICLLESSDINFAFTPSSGLYDITYTANGQSVTIDNYNGANPVYTVTPSQTTTYVVTNIAYDQVPQCAIQPNTSIVVIVNPLPALNNSNYTFCSDVATTTLQYIPDANTYTYNWLPNTSANYPGQNNGPSVINVTLPNPVGNAPTDFYYVTNLTNNATGCHALDSILVTINPNPVGTFTLPTTGCVNSPIALSNGDATIGSYEWSIDGTLYSLLANPAPPVFTVLGDHTIEMVAINQYGCTDTLNSVIQIYDQPVANFTTDTDYGCAPLDVNFTNLSSGLYVTSYDWTFAPDTVSWNYQYSSTNLVNPPGVTYLQGDVTTIYTATLAVTNACGTVTAQHDITVLPTPVAAFTLATHTICSGSSLVLNNISVGEPLTYYWTYGNTISYNPNLLSMYFPSDSVTHVYPLTLTLTNACGTDTYMDSVTVLPDLINGGFITTADAGCSPLTVTLTNTTFNTNLSATWHLDDPLNTIVSNQNSVQFTYYATNNITQNYNPYLVVTDGCASDTIVANLNVFANPLPIISASQSNLCAGTTINFSGAITGGDTGFGYNWDFGGLGTSNSATTSFTFPAGTAPGLAIPITLTATSPTFSGTNCSNTTTTVIHVYNNPDLSQISFNTTSGCSDLGVTVSNLPAATNQINWGDGTTNFNNSHIYVNNGPALLSYPVTVNSTITYGTIPALSCSTIANQLVNVYPTPLPQIFASGINVCEGDNIDFIASTTNNQNTGITYLWNFGTLGTSTNGNTSIVFNNGNSTGLQTPVQLTAFQNTSGTICSAAVNDNVYVYDTPDLTTALYSDVNSCSPLLVSITNLPTSTYLYNWGDGTTTSNPNHLYLNQGTTPLTYNVTIDATSYYPTLPLLACNAIANQVVQVNPQPFAAFTFSSDESCLYNPVTTTLQNNSLNAIAPYVWNYDGIAHTTNSLNYIGTFNTAGAHPVELIVSNQFGCTDSVSHDFIIHELPTVTLNAIDDDLCNGTTAEFEIDGTGISTSSWDFGDGTTLNLLNPTSLIHYYSQPGVYSVTAIVTSIYGCSDTLSFPNEVIVHPSPTASFTTSATTADIVYPYFEFYNNSAGAINYYWNFGDSNWSNDINPTHTYNSEGNYLVELTVTNEYNCFDIATEVVHVEGIVVYIPNAFTPLDYNGVNDVFQPSFSSTEGIEFYEFTIYDRWGIKIFQTNDITEPWIGNSKENNPGDDNYYAQNDVYTYSVMYRKKARADDPQPDRIVTGHVTIIR